MAPYQATDALRLISRISLLRPITEYTCYYKPQYTFISIRLGDFWRLQLVRPAVRDLERFCTLAVRTAKYKELCRSYGCNFRCGQFYYVKTIVIIYNN